MNKCKTTEMIFGIFRRLEKENAKLEAKLSDLQSEYCELENFHNSEIKEMEAYNEKLLNSDIEKHNQIVLLKEENAKLKDIISNQSESLRITLLEEDNKAKRIKELEKENAELIQENEEMKKGLGCETCQLHLEYVKLNQKITELETLYRDSCCKNCDNGS